LTLRGAPAFGNRTLDPGPRRIDDGAPALDEPLWYHTPRVGGNTTRAWRCHSGEDDPAERSEEQPGHKPAAAFPRRVVTH